MGQALPLHATAAGKAWVAHLPESEALALVLERGLSGLTEHTITTSTSSGAAMKTIRSEGYALSVEELMTDVISLAVPILANKGNKQTPSARSLWSRRPTERIAAIFWRCFRMSVMRSRFSSAPGPPSCLSVTRDYTAMVRQRGASNGGYQPWRLLDEGRCYGWRRQGGPVRGARAAKG